MIQQVAAVHLGSEQAPIPDTEKDI